MSFNDDFIRTRRAVRAIPARSPDELDDYFHDTIVKGLEKGKILEHWLGYLYKSVSRRVACGQEGRVYLPLEESLIPDERPHDNSQWLDIKRAFTKLSPRRRTYIYEHFYEGYTLEEIAVRYGVTNQAVMITIQRGLKVMREVLEDI